MYRRLLRRAADREAYIERGAQPDRTGSVDLLPLEPMLRVSFRP